MTAGKFTIDLSSQVGTVRSDLKNYQKRQLPNAVNAALGDTIRGLKTFTARYMSKKVISMNITTIGKQIFAVRPKRGSYKAKLIFKRKKVSSIASFKYKKQRRFISGKRRLSGEGIRAKVWESSKLYKGSFIWERQSSSGLAATAFRRDTSKGKVTPKAGRGRKTYQRNYTDKQGVFHAKGSIIKRQPLVKVFGTSVAAAFDQKPPKGNRPPVRVTLAERARSMFKEKLELRIAKIK